VHLERNGERLLRFMQVSVGGIYDYQVADCSSTSRAETVQICRYDVEHFLPGPGGSHVI
jgi:hypothetical protein